MGTLLLAFRTSNIMTKTIAQPRNYDFTRVSPRQAALVAYYVEQLVGLKSKLPLRMVRSFEVRDQSNRALEHERRRAVETILKASRVELGIPELQFKSTPDARMEEEEHYLVKAGYLTDIGEIVYETLLLIANAAAQAVTELRNIHHGINIVYRNALWQSIVSPLINSSAFKSLQEEHSLNINLHAISVDI